MTQTELDSFIQTLMNASCFASWYWDMLDLARGKFTAERYGYAKRSYSDPKYMSKSDVAMGRKLLHFYEHRNDPDTELYLNIVRLFVPLVANNAQRPDHLEFSENKYHMHLIEFSKFIGDAKLRYDFLTRVINRLNDKLQFQKYKEVTDLYQTRNAACAMRGFCDYAVHPEKYIKPDEITKKGGNKIKAVREERMYDLHNYMTLTREYVNYNICNPTQKLTDIPEIKMKIATAIIQLGWEQLGEIAAKPRHVWNDPNDILGKAISNIGNNVRRGVAMAGATPEIMHLLDDIVWPKFGTADLRQKIVTNTFNPNEMVKRLEQVKLKIAKEKNDNQK